MSTSTLNPATTAVLAMDFQKLIVDSYPTGKPALLQRTRVLLDAARGVGIRVIYVAVGFRPGFPEISPRNAMFSSVKSSNRLGADNPGVAIHPDLAPAKDEVVVTKHRVSAFAGTDLEMILRANGIDTLILAGIATSGVVLSTLRHAADADYRLLVAADCCSDGDAEVHRVLMEKIFPRQATVLPSVQIVGAFAQPG